MKNEIYLFEDRDLTVNLSKLIETRMLICANSGGGKSYAVRKLLEETYGTQAIIVDMEGEFHTLREEYNFLLIGGTQGDIKLNPKAVKLLPKSLLELNVSTILDLSELKHRERIMFVKEFLDSLMELPRELWRPLIVVIDEAHKLCGQQEMQESTFAVIDLMAQGRKRGFCGVLCTQRISKLHKDAAAEANNYMVGRTSLDVDMKRASELLGFTSKEDILSLRKLNPGEFYVYGPAINNEITKVRVAKVKTTHPESGKLLRATITPASEEIKSILTKLNELPQEQERNLKERGDLLKRIRELEQEKKAGQMNKPVVDTKQVERLRQEVSEIKTASIAMSGVNKVLNQENIQLKRKLEGIGKILGTEIKLPEIKNPQYHAEMQRARIHSVSISKPHTSDASALPEGGGRKFGRCEMAILKFLAMREGKEFTKVQIGAMTNYSPNSGGFNNALSILKTSNLINYSNGKVSISDVPETIQILGDDYSSPEPDSLEIWLSKLGLCARKIYQVLKENQDTSYSKDELGELTGYSPDSGGFNNAISELRTLGLAERIDGRIQFNPEIQNI